MHTDFSRAAAATLSSTLLVVAALAGAATAHPTAEPATCAEGVAPTVRGLPRPVGARAE